MDAELSLFLGQCGQCPSSHSYSQAPSSPSVSCSAGGEQPAQSHMAKNGRAGIWVQGATFQSPCAPQHTHPEHWWEAQCARHVLTRVSGTVPWVSNRYMQKMLQVEDRRRQSKADATLWCDSDPRFTPRAIGVFPETVPVLGTLQRHQIDE